jgi:flagellar hook protein FlgE
LDATATQGAANGRFSTSIEVIDSLGNSHIVTIDFTRTATANQWDYSLTFPASDVTTPIPAVTGTLQFNGNGLLTSPTPASTAPVLNITGLRDGASNMSITWNIFNGATPRMTQFSQPSASSALAQDGSVPANLLRVGLADGGRVVAQYSNGQQVIVGQTAMAAVRNPQSLLAAGNNNYQLSADSAIPAIGLPGTGGRGSVLGGTVEASTVDIAREFTNLIIFQRGYQANARVVTTVDEMSQETINLKR